MPPGSPPSPFILGVNYWPRNKAMFMWQHFDPGEIREEFAMIKDLGLTHVRLFLLWESFQPDPRTVSSKAIGDLRTVADSAADLGLKLEPTFFTGHMSGPNWAPDWLISKQPRHPNERWLVSLDRFTPSPNTIYNIYTEPFVREAEKLQLRTVCGSLKDHPALWAWSLGNEPDLFCRPPTDAVGREWIRTMAATIKQADPHHLVTIGFHTVSADSNCGLRIDHAAESTDYSVMHGYSIYHPVARHMLDTDWVPFTCGLTAALAGRPVLYEEFGLCTREPDQPSGYQTMTFPFGKKHRQFFASHEDAAAYYAAVLPKLHRMGALGAFAWCFGDYAPSLWDKPPCDVVIHERFFGLYRADGTLKPMGEAVKKFAVTHPTVRPPERTVSLGMTPDAYYQNAWQNIQRLYQQFGSLDGNV
jgi:endo-1,4-beta-mannosidase